MTRRLFVHCVGSLPSIRRLQEPGSERWPERALLLASPGDAVCVPAPVDPDYLEFLAGLGIGPRAGDVIVAAEGTEGALTDRLLARPEVLVPLLGEPGDEILLHPYAVTDPIHALAATLRCAGDLPVRVYGGLPEVVRHADHKHHMRVLAMTLGIPVAEGEVAELAHPGGRRRGDFGPVRAAIERQLVRSGRVIVRGAFGSSGCSAFVVGRGGDDTDGVVRRLAQRGDNRIYLVEEMVEATTSPNLLLEVPPGGGSIGPAAITDQRWGRALVHIGNQSPSSARMIEAMEGWARMLACRLRRDGFAGTIGFDFVEHRDPRTGGPAAFLAEVNPRVNGSAYPLAAREQLAPRSAFVSGKVVTRAPDFAAIRSALGPLLFDPERGSGIVPYAVGCLQFGNCSLVALAGSRLRAAELYGAAQSRVEAL